MLPSAVPVQPVGRPGTSDASARQSRQREVLAAGALAGNRAVSSLGHPEVLSWRCRLCQSGTVPSSGERRLSLRHSLKANAVLEREIEHLLTRPVGRPSRKPKVFYHSFQYQAKSWKRSRRVVAKVEWHQGELFARVGFIVTNLNKRSKNVVQVLQRQRYCRAVDQGRQERRQMDEALLPHVQGQSGVSIRLRSPVGQKYEEVFGESDGECMACGQKTTPKPVCGGGVWHQDAL